MKKKGRVLDYNVGLRQIQIMMIANFSIYCLKIVGVMNDFKLKKVVNKKAYIQWKKLEGPHVYGQTTWCLLQQGRRHAQKQRMVHRFHIVGNRTELKGSTGMSPVMVS